MIAKGDLLKKWPPGAHTSTFQGNPIACAVACATLREIENSKLIEHVSNSIALCFGKLKNDLISNDFVKDVRFVGAQCAIEFNNSVTANEVQKLALSQAKLLTYGGGRKGECVLLLPHINID